VKPLDRLLQRWRIAKTRPFLSRGDRVLDVGSADGALFRELAWLGPGVGIDPEVDPSAFPAHARPVRGVFPDDMPAAETFDAITMLAVLEHVPSDVQPRLARACADVLRPGGHLLVTVPSPLVDRILEVLLALRVLDGMETGQHFGYDVEQTPVLFRAAGLVMVERRRFQLGLNHFFAFRKPS
jgi:2-polyprenyl-3-methyl-5-hydroxy-6-metoxy-1,4-benzoquinol methylase